MQWRQIPGYEGLYSVSEFGHVQVLVSCTSVKAGYLLKPKSNHHGYLIVGLRKQGKRQFYFLHRLVALAFIGTLPNGHNVNHKDGDKTNNHFSNLEYTTPRENSQHAAKLGLLATGDRSGSRLHPERLKRGTSHHNAKLNNELVHEIKRQIANGQALRAIARTFAVSQRTIQNIARGIIWKEVD